MGSARRASGHFVVMGESFYTKDKNNPRRH